jgi:hypothetical protein
MAKRLTTFAYLGEYFHKARLYDDTITLQMQGGDPIYIPQAGKTIANAYEQLRNAAEYTDGNITLQRAIKRFYKRTLFISRHKPKDIGQELVIELVTAGYLQDGSLGINATHILTQLVDEHVELYHRLRSSKITQRQAASWTLSVLSARTYNMLVPRAYDLTIASYAYQYFLEQLPQESFAESKTEAENSHDALYVAVHQALLQSDVDTVRADLLQLHGIDGSDMREYIKWCAYAREIYTSPHTLRLKRVVSRNGAPFRVLRSLAATSLLDELLQNREAFLKAYHEQIHIEYRRLNKRLNSGVLKSITFLFLTKVTIGLAVEVPFDRYVYGHIVALPLAINLLFPPLYMASIWLSLPSPSADNARATARFIDQLLYEDTAPVPYLPKGVSTQSRARVGIGGILFLVPFTVTYFALHALGFNLLQMVIFLIFFSTASFLGFRLSLMVRELRMSNRESSVLSILRDFFYLPFILVGQWLAGKYAEINVIGELFDLIIELPLKTVLSLIRQWIRFLREKHEELY